MVSIIVVTWNNLRYTQECIEFLTAYTDVAYELIVVDNGSTDGTIEWLNELRSEDRSRIALKIIRNSLNEGFAHAVNEGLAEASGDYVFLLNNDLLVSPGWLGTLIGHLETLPNAGAVGPMGGGIGGKHDYVASYGSVPYNDDGVDKDLFVEFSQRIAHDYAGDYTEAKSLSGCCLLIATDLFRTLGGLDEGHKMGADDADLSLRLRLQGYRLYIAEDVYVHHYGHVSFALLEHDLQDQVVQDSWTYFNRKWRDVGVPWDTLFMNEEHWNYEGWFRNRRGFASTLRPDQVRLDLGAGKFPAGGVGNSDWIHCDILSFPCIVVVCDVRNLPFPDNHAEEIYASNVIEHFTLEEVSSVLKEWARVLKPGHTLTIITPDIEHTCREYVAGHISGVVVSMNFLGEGGFWENMLRSLWDRVSLTIVLQNHGFVEVVRDTDYPEWQLKLVATKG